LRRTRPPDSSSPAFSLLSRSALSRTFCACLLAALSIALPALPILASPPGADDPVANAEALVRAGHWKRARAILEPRVNAHPQEARACYLLAQVKVAFNDLNGALDLAQRAANIDSRSSDYHLTLGQNFGRLAAQASIFSAGPLAIKFRKEVEIAIELDPKNLDALDSMMIFKYRAPALMGGDKDEAQALAEKIISINPSAGYLAEAELAELQNNPAQQEAYFLKAVQANPNNYEAQTALAKFYTQSGHAKYEEAANHAQSARRLDAARIGAYWVLARVFALEARWSELEQTLATGEKQVPDDLRPSYESAQALLETGKDFARAESCARKYLSQEPEGEEPDSADAHRLLGLIFEREGRRGEARGEMQTALRLRPGFKDAKEDLKRLGG
jgi:tetratricopeptide (TPR) repeat protein